MSAYEDRQQEKLERYQDLARRNSRKGKELLRSANEERALIPLGQPILIGHHSETSHRNHLKRLRRREERGWETLEKANYYETKVANIEDPKAVSSDDPDAIEKLEAELEKLERKREDIKENNKKARREGKEAAPSFLLKNLGANIRRIRQRIEYLRAMREKESTEIEINGVRILNNAEENRVQMFFDGKPAEETRKELKRNGFRWSPRNGCWQRMLGNHAEYLAKEIAKKMMHSSR